MSHATDLAESHAPIVIIHPGETFAPMSADTFVNQSSLVWRRSDTRADTIARRGYVDPGRLGENAQSPYTHVDGAIEASACELTRPFEDNKRQRVRDLPLEKGFAMLNRHSIPGRVETSYELEQTLASTPIYYQIHRSSKATFLCYWLFFGSSAPPYHALRVKAEEVIRQIGDKLNSTIRGVVTGPQRWVAQPTADIGDAIRLVTRKHAHQGDWEGVTAKLSPRGRLQSVHFRAHHGGHEVDPAQSTVDGRIVLYCSRGSHACYESPTSPMNRDGDVMADDGPRWDPLAVPGGLLDASAQPWFGFGGAWGDPGLDHRVHVDVARKDLAGPLGPSRFKRIWPSRSRAR